MSAGAPRHLQHADPQILTPLREVLKAPFTRPTTPFRSPADDRGTAHAATKIQALQRGCAERKREKMAELRATASRKRLAIDQVVEQQHAEHIRNLATLQDGAAREVAASAEGEWLEHRQLNDVHRSVASDLHSRHEEESKRLAKTYSDNQSRASERLSGKLVGKQAWLQACDAQIAASRAGLSGNLAAEFVSGYEQAKSSLGGVLAGPMAAAQRHRGPALVRFTAVDPSRHGAAKSCRASGSVGNAIPRNVCDAEIRGANGRAG
jgi:hypothetical protein